MSISRYYTNTRKEEVAIQMIYVLGGKPSGLRQDILRSELHAQLGYWPNDSLIYSAARMLRDHGIRVPTDIRGPDTVWFLIPDGTVQDNTSMEQTFVAEYSEMISKSRSYRADPRPQYQSMADEYQSMAMDVGKRLQKTNAEVFNESSHIYTNNKFDAALAAVSGGGSSSSPIP